MDEQHTKTTDSKPTGRRYATVDELLRGEKAPLEVIEETQKLADETKFTRMLAALRAKGGLTQAEMGERMTPPRTQSAISKLESGRDEDLSIADIREYSKALNERIGLVFGQPLNHVEAIKMYALAMRERMLALVKLAHQDGQLEKEVQAFFGEAFFNILTILGTCQQQMPKKDFEVKMHIHTTSSFSKPSSETPEPKSLVA